jgi:hypothetical protein
MIDIMTPYIATASQKITLNVRNSLSYLIKFFDLILGIFIAEPRSELPVTKIPLRTI